MNKIMIYTFAFLSSSLYLLQANVACPKGAISYKGLDSEKISDYRNRCSMQIDFDKEMLVPSGQMTVDSGSFGARVQANND